MKIAVFTDTFLPEINGVTKTLGKMKDHMDKGNIEYKFFVPGKEDTKTMYDNIISFTSFNFFLYPECKIAIPKYKDVKKTLDDFKPDIIHIVTPFSIGLTGMKYAKDYNIPLVASYHTDFPKYLRFYNLDILESTIWKFFRWFHSHCYMNFCPSRDTRNDMIKHGIENVELWGRGIERDKFSPNKRSEELRGKYCDDEEKMLLYVGRVAPEKELDILIKSAEILNQKGLKYKLVVVGDGPAKEELEKRNIENIIFAGYKTGEELLSYYASADIFTFPSSSETYGNVILEAMASGLAVVTPYAGGIKENLKDMYNGLAMKPGDPQDMADKIEILINNEELRKTIIKNGLEYIKTKSWDSIYKGLFNKYELVIAQSKNKYRKISA